jgi:PPOX class probable F420-dependent enzyme
VTGERLWQIITGGRDGILATIGEDGMPHLSNVYYLADPATRLIRLSTTTVRIKGRNLQRDPRASLHVAGRDFFNFAVAEGDVMLAAAQAPDDAAVDELFEVHSALGAAADRAGFGDQMVANHRMVVRLAVRRVYGQLLDR